MEIVTIGITGWFFWRVRIDKKVWHLDVGLKYPVGVAAYKGWFVQPLKFYMS